MARKVLTPALIRRLTTSKPSEYVWHRKWPHKGSFGIRVHKTGRKTWLWRENLQDAEGNTKTVSHKLGTYPDLDLEGAMRRASGLARVASSGDGMLVADLVPIMVRRYEREGKAPNTIVAHYHAEGLLNAHLRSS